MNEMFSKSGIQLLEHARDEAARLKHDYIGGEHILYAFIKLNKGFACKKLKESGLDFKALKESLGEHFPASSGTMQMGQLPLTAIVKRALLRSGQEAIARKSSKIEPEHILLGLLYYEEGPAVDILSLYNINYKNFQGKIIRE
jgi:ATP-dependent Clp protease ATP-binding subunit ClpC